MEHMEEDEDLQDLKKKKSQFMLILYENKN